LLLLLLRFLLLRCLFQPEQVLPVPVQVPVPESVQVPERVLREQAYVQHFCCREPSAHWV
jgi:hypothetical protein